MFIAGYQTVGVLCRRVKDMNRKAHWESIYSSKAPTEVSWYQEYPKRSLELISDTGIGIDAHIIDVGGGASTLVDGLLDSGFRNITVLDISATALDQTKARLGERGKAVTWLEADITRVTLPHHEYDLWHDRAVFHFLTTAEARESYVNAVRHSLKPNGHIIVATFAPDGPTRCSGLDIVRYSPDELHDEFGSDFQYIKSVSESHPTPFGTYQKFMYCYCKKS
jgi:2-polyprenyl-3-methyl-5-hydroxy-6-metoxy-1,4-benzoquinol methylase